MTEERWEEIKKQFISLYDDYGSDCPDHSCPDVPKLLKEIEADLHLTLKN